MKGKARRQDIFLKVMIDMYWDVLQKNSLETLDPIIFKE